MAWQHANDADWRRREHSSRQGALKQENLLHDDEGKVGQVHDQVDLKNLKPDQWWWD